MTTRKIITRENREEARLEFIDAETKEVVATSMPSKHNQKRVAEGKKPMKHQRHYYKWKTNKNGKCLLVRSDTNAKELADDYTLFKAHPELCLNIAYQIGNGETFSSLKKIKGEDFPPAPVILYWYSQDPDFKAIIDEARKVRAEFYHDQVHEVAAKVRESNSKSAKVKIDAYKLLMSVGDRDRFGNQTKLVGDPNKPISFMVDTGIHAMEGQTIESTAITKRAPEEIEGPQAGSYQDGVRAEDSPEGNPSEPEEV